MTLTASALAALEAATSQGLHEDAAPAHARARERLLQFYRDALLDRGHLGLSAACRASDPWGEDDAAGVEWLARLAAAGHLPAQDLLDRALVDERLAQLQAAVPDRFAALWTIAKPVARFLARAALKAEYPDTAKIAAWLDAGDAACREAAQALRWACSLGTAPNAAEFAMLERAVSPYAAVSGSPPATAAGLQRAFAFSRLLSEQEADRVIGERMLGAVVVGEPVNASTLRWLGGLAIRHPDVMRTWLLYENDPLATRTVTRVRTGMLFESGDADGVVALAEAVRWYEFAVGSVARTGIGGFDARFCREIANVTERLRFALGGHALPIARVWYERGLDAGEPECFAWCLNLAVGEHVSFEADVGIAAEYLNRFERAGGSLAGAELPRETLESIVTLSRAALRGVAPGGPASALEWLQIGVRLEQPDCLYLMGAAFFNGDIVPRDLDEARRLLENAATRGNLSARTLLERWPAQ